MASSDWYFSHRFDARNDVKILMLDEALGEHIGYSLFFKSLEVMGETGKYCLPKGSLTNCRAMGISMDLYDHFIDSGIACGLFEVNDDGHAYSVGYLKHLAKRADAREKGRQGGIRSAEKRANDQAKPQADGQAELICDHWNATASKMRCAKLTDQIRNVIARRLREFTTDDLKRAVTNYWSVVDDPNCFFSYAWTLGEFMSRKNGFEVFVQDGVVERYRKRGREEGRGEW